MKDESVIIRLYQDGKILIFLYIPTLTPPWQ